MRDPHGLPRDTRCGGVTRKAAFPAVSQKHDPATNISISIQAKPCQTLQEMLGNLCL